MVSTQSNYDGVLSPAERAYLRGEREFPSKEAEYQARLRLKRKMKPVLEDVALYARGASELDRQGFLQMAHPEDLSEYEWVVNPVTGEEKPMPLPIDDDPVDPDGDADRALWGRVAILGILMDILRWSYLSLREAESPQDDVLRAIESTLAAAEGEYQHGWPGWHDNAVEVAVEMNVSNIESSENRQ